MHVLLINQTFYPDVAATAQYAADLTARLVECGHEVTVLTSRRSYTDPAIKFRESENWRGVKILRCWTSRFGKGAKSRRALDFAAFFIAAAVRLPFISQVDTVVALTSPPLVSALGAITARSRKARFIYWVMDLNPDEAIAAGWLRSDSFLAKVLDAVSHFSLRHADQVVALDRFMAERLIQKGVPEEKLLVIPPWPQDDAIAYDPQGALEFRRRHSLEDKFIVMYSGNHSPCHPLDTLMEAARRLRQHPRIAFCFIGGGSEFARVERWVKDHTLANVICLPYQPFADLSASLSAADLHAVVMGDAFVGIVHPSKVYNIRRVGVPFIHIGPAECPIAELGPAASFRHGDADGVRDFVATAAERRIPISPAIPGLTQKILIEQLVAAIGKQPQAALAEPICR